MNYENLNIYFYKNLDEATKKYINKAIDIYYAIEYKTIEYNFYDAGKKIADYADKFRLSIYIASFLVDNNLNNILKKEYNHLDIEDLFSFVSIKQEDIIEFSNKEYERDYNSYFIMRVQDYIKENSAYRFDKLTPELLFLCASNSDVIVGLETTIFGEDYHTKPFVREIIQDFAIENNLISIRFVKASKLTPKVDKGDAEKFLSFFGKMINIELPDEDDIDGYNKTILSSKDMPKEKVWDILEEAKKKFIGQETATENLFYNIVNNQELAKRDDVSDGERSIIFLDGPTGTGKTAITKEITNKLDITFTSTSVINYSSTGYVGGDITDTLKTLYEKSNGDLEKAQRGIIVFDEFDKIAYNQVGGLGMKQAVQQQLLDFMGGGKYKITIGNNIFSTQEIEFDTSKLTFVCLGALTNLRSKKTELKQPIGFGEVNVQNNDTYNITPQDLIDIGLEKELVGRFNTYLHTEEYSKIDLFRILTKSTISPMLGFKKWIESQGKYLEIEDGVYDLIASAAYELNTGARSLQTIMNNIRTPFIKKVLRDSDEVILLNVDIVANINESTLSRKARM